MGNYLLNFIIGIVEAQVPNSKPFIDGLQAQIASGKITGADFETDAENLLQIAENFLPKYKAFFEDLIGDIRQVDKTVADFKAAQV